MRKPLWKEKEEHLTAPHVEFHILGGCLLGELGGGPLDELGEGLEVAGALVGLVGLAVGVDLEGRVALHLWQQRDESSIQAVRALLCTGAKACSCPHVDLNRHVLFTTAGHLPRHLCRRSCARCSPQRRC